MHFDVVLLSQIQFAFVVSFLIIFPSFTIGLATWATPFRGKLKFATS
jgi:cytochrome bd ubiquinol oxidase subunit I